MAAMASKWTCTARLIFCYLIIIIIVELIKRSVSWKGFILTMLTVALPHRLHRSQIRPLHRQCRGWRHQRSVHTWLSSKEFCALAGDESFFNSIHSVLTANSLLLGMSMAIRLKEKPAASLTLVSWINLLNQLFLCQIWIHKET